jgi:hypothetical protein
LGTSLPGRVVFVAAPSVGTGKDQNRTTLYACIIVQELKQVVNFFTNREQDLRTEGRQGLRTRRRATILSSIGRGNQSIFA